MEGMRIEPDYQYLDVTASPSFLGLYTQLCLAYALPDSSRHQDIVQRLEKGLEQLSTSFPWVAGQISKDGDVIKMKPLASTPKIVVKDYTNDSSFSSMDDYRKLNFPFSMLDESLLCPVNTLPGDFAQGSAPILFVQVNFILGGMLLTFTAEHSAMDMTGQAQLISLLSKACKGETFTEAELQDGNVDRRAVVKLLDEYTIGPELEHQIKKTKGPAIIKASGGDDINSRGVNAQTEPPTEYVWAYLTFSDASLKTLKDIATQSLSSGFVSTDDVISAFIWQLVARARSRRYSQGTNTTFARAIDVRRFLGVSKTYIGLLDNMTYHTYTLQQAAEMPLGLLAFDLRQALDSETTRLEYNTRALATAFVQAKDKTIFSTVANIELDKDITLSSWANINTYDLDFGFGLGTPESVRRPRLAPVESLVYIMPRDKKGSSAVAICLRMEDMNTVRVDPDFLKYARYVG